MRLALSFLFAVGLLVAAAAGSWYVVADSDDLLAPLNSVPTSIADLSARLKDLQPISTPPPLRRALFSEPSSNLTIEGVLTETNRHRATETAPALTTNKLLNEVAQEKLRDMFTQQYFDHVSPDGIGPGDLVDASGYISLRTAENLALGGFRDDADLVQAWMDSPGHRANIMEPAFEEIGIAVGKGMFEGYETWLAVQTFARPASACPAVDATVRAQFADLEAKHGSLTTELSNESTILTEMRDELDSIAADISALAVQGNAKIAEGNEKIEAGNAASEEGNQQEAEALWAEGEALQQEGKEIFSQAETKEAEHADLKKVFDQQRTAYNHKVSEQNELSDELEGLAATLNAQIGAYNACLEQ